MKRWFIQHKTILIGFSITSVILMAAVFYQFNIILQPEAMQDLKIYAETKEITPVLQKYAFVAIISITIFVIWALLFMIIIWRIFFPSKKKVREAFSFDSIEFLYKMPENIRKELKQ